MKYTRHNQLATRGFTFVEALIVIALMVILGGAVSQTIVWFYQYNGYAIAQSGEVQNARQGIEQLVRDMREMTYADDGTFPIAQIDDNSVSFYSDIDKDDSVEYVTYTLDGTNLIKRIYNASGSPPIYDFATPASSSTLSRYVQNNLQSLPVFLYYDATGMALSTTSPVTEVRYIEASIIVNIDPIRDPGEFLLRSSASLRNLQN